MVTAVVGVVSLVAAITAVEAPAEFGGAARKDAAHRPVVVGAKALPVSLSVSCPMLTEQLCEIESHERRSRRLGIGEGVEGGAGSLFADLGEVEVAHDLLERAVAEVGGDLSHGGPAFEHVGGEGVAQGVG